MSVNGILFVDKAEGWTSHDVVAKARRTLGTRKVGHAGTLDPMATGLLTLGVGPSTRLLTYFVGLDKTYTATIRLGASTITDDREGEVTHLGDTVHVRAVTEGNIREAARAFTGDILQIPSRVSAVKIDGERAYRRVRAGKDVELPPRPIRVHEYAIHTVTPTETDDGHPVIDVTTTITCSSGTYIRALARDLGEALHIGGHLTELRRIAVGPFSLAPHDRSGLAVEAVTTEALAAGEGSDDLVAPAEAARAIMPELQLGWEDSEALSHGKRVTVSTKNRDLAAAVAPDGSLIGLVEITEGTAKTVMNFPRPEPKGTHRD